MLEINRHPNIELMTFTDIKEISGYIGNFVVKVEKKPRYVDEGICKGSGMSATIANWLWRVLGSMPNRLSK